MRCPSCNGNGHRNGDRSRDDDCHQCNGSGEACRKCGESAPNGHELCESCSESQDIPHPIYTLYPAFGPESEAIVTVFGWPGLLDAVPRLDVGLYMICIGCDEVGVGEKHPLNWAIIMNDGTRAGPGGPTAQRGDRCLGRRALDRIIKRG